MLKCIALDDEELALELLEDNISKVPFLQLVAKCSDPFEAIKLLETEQVDLIFADIQMPGLTGLQFIQSLSVKPMIILVTAYEKFALQGFNLEVLDYLVKPVSFDRFMKACNKAKELYNLKKGNLPESASGNNQEYFFVSADYKLLKITVADVIWIEGLKDYLKIHLQNALHPVVTRMSMKNIEEELPKGKFMRIHKSYIVAVSHITAVMKSSVFIGDLRLPVGDNYRDELDALTGMS